RGCCCMSPVLVSAVSYYLTSSMYYGSELEQLVVAVNRLGQSGNSEATETLRWARESWYDVMLEALGDPTLAKLALLAGDGISYHLDITVDKDDGLVTEETLDAMVKAIQQAGSFFGPVGRVPVVPKTPPSYRVRCNARESHPERPQ